MSASRTKKEVSGFLGYINYTNHLIAKLTTTCGRFIVLTTTYEALFKLLRKNDPNVWNTIAKAFKDQNILVEPSCLSAFGAGHPLLKYLAVHETSTGCVLGQHDESGKKKKAIYYLSKKIIDHESHCSTL